MKTSHKQKHKKKKKKNHKKRKERSSSDSESSSGEEWVEAPTCSKIKASSSDEEWVEATTSGKIKATSSDEELVEIPSTSKIKRDSWMNDESFVPTLRREEMFHSSAHQRKLDSLREQREIEEKVKNERELNPHWKNEGSGLPEKAVDVDNLSLPSTSVGDGGYSWLKKAYYRIQEQAQQEGKSMEKVAAERWGSLSKLESLIKEAEERMKSRSHKYSNSRYRHEFEREDRSSRERQFRKPHDYYDSEKNKLFDRPYEFKKPGSDRKHKILNQFKSSRQSTVSHYNLSEEEKTLSNKRSKSSIGVSEIRKEDYKDEKANSFDKGSHLPAWKKPKRVETKPMEKTDSITNNSHPTLTKDSIKDSIKTDDVPVIYSEDDLNKLAARQLKAEIMGDTSLALKLKNQLETAKKKVKEDGFATKESTQEVEVILTKLDNQGQACPIEVPQEKISDYKQRKSNKYFDDESKYSLRQMFEREKLTTTDDQMEMFVEAASKYDETSEIDFEVGNVSKKLTQKMNTGREEEKDIGKAIRQHQKLSAALEKCEYCLDQPNMKHHLLVDIGEMVYICLPNYQCLTEGHCLIVPKKHVSSFLHLDENEWREVNDFKRSLRNLFRPEKKSVIFLETSMNFRYCPHAVIDCIPVPEEDGDMAPFYFKKAILESEYEWTHNKKLVDLTNKDLRHSVPKNLPYFHVEFDPKVHAGYAHVIEEEKHFPRNFGKEILGGMLDIDYNCLFKNKKEDPLKKSKEVVKFEKKWSNFKEQNS